MEKPGSFRNPRSEARGPRPFFSSLLASTVVLLGLTLTSAMTPSRAAPAPRATGHAHPARSIWWEAETPRIGNFPARNPFAPADAAAAQALSGGKWIGADHAGKPLFLEYDVTIGDRAPYELYARKFWRHGPFRWRFDGQPWRECGPDVALLDAMDVGRSAVANWVHLGAVTLAPGTHVLRIELVDPDAPVALDCFLLTAGPFVPRGLLRPGEAYPPGPAGWFPFDPPFDAFTTSPLDLRRLNEARAGEGGFITARGNGFVHSKTGRPVRFWAVDVSHDVLGSDRWLTDRWARFLAKRGVNMVRLHGQLWRGDDPAKIDEVKLDRIRYLVAALAGQGIYLALSDYFPLWLQHLDKQPGFEGMGHDGHPFGLSFFNPRLQELQKAWWRAALSPPNPYTGVPLAHDPALAFIEIVNEDSLLFWTFAPYRSVPAAQIEILERRFGAWLGARDGTLGKSLARWGGRRLEGDDEAQGRAGVLPPSDLVARRDARARDTLEFLTAVQRSYFDGMDAFLKKDLGFSGSVTGSNWITADAHALGPLDKWSNAGCDFLDRHGYFSGPHEGEQASYLLSPGDRFNDALALKFETGKPGEVSPSLPIMDLAYNDKPSSISEISWVPPNRYRADLPALAAAYGALQGTDAFFFFAAPGGGWASALEKFTIADPAIMGQFSAAALIYREGLVKTADSVVRLELALPDLYAKAGPGIWTPQNLDGLRARDFFTFGFGSSAAGATAQTSFDPLAFLVGRVEVNVTAAGGRSRVDDVSRWIDRRARVVHSSTKELSWDWGRGVATIDAPAAQGAVGLLGGVGAIELGDLVIASRNDYGAVLLVALDGAPLRTSRRMLLQVMSEDTNTGWSAPGQGLRPIVAVGGPPIVVKKLAGHVRFKRAAGTRPLTVHALDLNGYPSGAAIAFANDDLELLPTTLYYLLEQ